MVLAFTAFTATAGQNTSTPFLRLYEQCGNITRKSAVDENPYYSSNGSSLGCKNETFSIGGIEFNDPSFKSPDNRTAECDFFQGPGCEGVPFSKVNNSGGASDDPNACYNAQLEGFGWQKSSYICFRSDS